MDSCALHPSSKLVQLLSPRKAEHSDHSPLCATRRKHGTSTVYAKESNRGLVCLDDIDYAEGLGVENERIAGLGWCC